MVFGAAEKGRRVMTQTRVAARNPLCAANESPVSPQADSISNDDGNAYPCRFRNTSRSSKRLSFPSLGTKGDARIRSTRVSRGAARTAGRGTRSSSPGPRSVRHRKDRGSAGTAATWPCRRRRTRCFRRGRTRRSPWNTRCEHESETHLRVSAKYSVSVTRTRKT